jgi:hypothetical protein
MIEYIPTTDQFVCVVNKKIEIPKIMNAIGHMAAGLVNRHNDSTEAMRFRDFKDMDEQVHPSISENGFIVLRSDNSNQLRTLRNKLIEENIIFTDFTETMVGGTYVDQQNVFNQTKEENLEYFGVCFFMNKEKSRELTKKFSLYTA